MAKFLSRRMRLLPLGLAFVASLSGLASAQSPLAIFNLDNSCTVQQKVLIDAARTTVWIPNFVNNQGGAFDACMRDAFISADKGLPVERILGIMREPYNTSIGCKQQSAALTCPGHWAGCASWFSPGSNSLNLSDEELCGNSTGTPCPTPAAVGNAVIADIAGTIVHEVAHNKNFEHAPDPPPSEYEYQLSVNEQLRACMEFLAPNLARRSSLSREVELAHIGGHGGGGNNLSESFCGDAFVTGLLITSDTLVRGVQPQCNSVSGGAGFAAPTIGRLPTGTGSLCPAGWFVTGLIGNNGDQVDRIGVTCSLVRDIIKGTSSNAPQSLFGGNGGLPFQRQCPPGMAIAGFQGRSGDALDQLRPVCRQIGVGYLAVHKAAQIAGRTEGVDEDLRCTGQGVMVGIYGRAGQLLDRIGGVCHSTLAQTNTSLIDNGMEHPTAAGLEASPGGSSFEDQCTNGSAVVGFATRSGDSVDQLAAICAKLSTWAAGATNTDPVSTMSCQTSGSPGPCLHGGSGGSHSERLMCSATEFVVGLETWRNEPSYKAGVVVRGLRPVCRHLPLADDFIRLAINKVGAGVVSSNAFNCDPTCLVELKVGSTVALKASPNPGWNFSRWEGTCSGSGSNPHCTLDPILSDSAATAVFVSNSLRTVTLKLIVESACATAGGGVVSTNPTVLTCQTGTALHPLANTCSVSVPQGTSVRFTATPSGYASVSYVGGCTSGSSTCPASNLPPLTINTNTDVTAKFCGMIQ